MANETNKTRIDSILDSFFAGCRKYDLYELAKKYATINPNDLEQMQQAITSKEITKEQMEYVVSTITVNSPIASSNGGGASASTPIIGNTEYFMSKYNQIGFYFANDYPKPSTSPSYPEMYDVYIGQKTTYAGKTNGTQLVQTYDTMVTPNYEIAKQMAIDVAEQIKNSEAGTVTIRINSSCSAPATVGYNAELSVRRINSVIKFFEQNSATKDYVAQKRLMVVAGTASGEVTSSTPMVSSTNVAPYTLPFSP
jgi:hypothetical protein